MIGSRRRNLQDVIGVDWAKGFAASQYPQFVQGLPANMPWLWGCPWHREIHAWVRALAGGVRRAGLAIDLK